MCLGQNGARFRQGRKLGSESMFDRFLDSLQGWKGVLFVVVWTVLIATSVIWVPRVLTFIVDLIFWPTGS